MPSIAAKLEASARALIGACVVGAVGCTLLNPLGYLQRGDGDAAAAACSPTVDPEHFVDAVVVSAHGSHTCAIRRSGGVVCWGANAQGETGHDPTLDNGKTMVPTAVALGPSSAIAVVAGEVHSCAVDESHATWCWGLGTSGQLGPASTSESFTPLQVSTSDGGAPYVAGNLLSAGEDFSCATAKGGGVWCWGDAAFASIGQDPNQDSTATGPNPVSGTLDATLLVSGDRHTCATLDGGVICWGVNDYGQLGAAVPTSCPSATGCSWVPVEPELGATLPITSIATGAGHSCAVDSSSNVSCWGQYDVGQTGDTSFQDIGTAADLPHPVLTGPGSPLGDVVAVAAGGLTSCVLDKDGAVLCFGGNPNGQLGQTADVVEDGGVLPAHPTPMSVPGLAGATAITIGDDHVCAIVGCGSVYCWGANDTGQLGDGTLDSRPTPALVSAPVGP